MTKQEIDLLISEQGTIINDRMARLSSSDYKRIKMFEAATRFLAQKYPDLAAELPYSMDIFGEADSQRSDINAAQAEIDRLSALEPDPEDQPGESSEPTPKKTRKK